MRIVIMDKRAGEAEREVGVSELTEEGAHVAAGLLDLLSEEIREHEYSLRREEEEEVTHALHAR